MPFPENFQSHYSTIPPKVSTKTRKKANKKHNFFCHFSPNAFQPSLDFAVHNAAKFSFSCTILTWPFRGYPLLIWNRRKDHPGKPCRCSFHAEPQYKEIRRRGRSAAAEDECAGSPPPPKPPKAAAEKAPAPYNIPLVEQSFPVYRSSALYHWMPFKFPH